MAAHELAKVWKSRVGTTNDRDFDISNMMEDGDARNCRHGVNSITGVTTKIDPELPEAPSARFFVRFDEKLTEEITLKYRGVAIRNPATNQINRIVGFMRIVTDIQAKGRSSVDASAEIKKLLLGQEEGTWVGTQP